MSRSISFVFGNFKIFHRFKSLQITKMLKKWVLRVWKGRLSVDNTKECELARGRRSVGQKSSVTGNGGKNFGSSGTLKFLVHRVDF